MVRKVLFPDGLVTLVINMFMEATDMIAIQTAGPGPGWWSFQLMVGPPTFLHVSTHGTSALLLASNALPQVEQKVCTVNKRSSRTL